MKRSLAVHSLIVVWGLSLSGTAFAQGDFYIRSQHSNGTFTGFHEILPVPKQGYHKAEYCGRTFWVSSTTVMWTEEEVEAGRTLILEENLGTTRRTVCADSTSFATLDDLGLKAREVESLRGDTGFTDTKTRLRNISEAFK
ncbi:hypothetical protein E1180_20510 [Roseibium denhamense]|uniref:Uncharacterized protein n=1 Tax=Roseibium denhamense TaxID=76305 RepID=A0ABY1NSC5_9HYPH|nr:hypothetical protein [Roseibium denhamense]MTI07887.1 hypothetical protein [Roseibium denhamense]SMP14734.1 hypothetical protein SAMN06265374_1469 [Roseibium denhamense]